MGLCDRTRSEFASPSRDQAAYAIGHNKLVAELFGSRITGFVAWPLWRGVYILKISAFGRKVRVILERNWAMYLPPDIAPLGYTSRSVVHDGSLETTGEKVAA